MHNFRVKNRFSKWLAVVVAGLLLQVPIHAEVPQLRLWLKDGSFVDGQLQPSKQNDHVRFRSPVFDAPIEFDVRGVRSAAGDFAPEENLTGHNFLLEGGTRISGQLQEWTDEFLVVESLSLGSVQLQQSLLRAVESVEDGGKRVYSGPKSLDDWKILDDTDKWSFAAGSLTSPDLEAKAAGNVELPQKFRLSLSMSWEGRADFVLSLGCKEPKKRIVPPDQQNRVRRAMVQPTQDSAAVRLEMWDAQLAVVREVGNLADIAVLPLDDGISKFELVFYVDQVAGLVAVYSPRGKMLEKIQVAEEQGQSNAFALLENHGKSVSLDRFDVYQWDGHLPDSTEYPDSYVLDKNGEVINASIGGFDNESGLLTLVGDDPDYVDLKFGSVRRIVLVPAKAGSKNDPTDDDQSDDDDNAQQEAKTDTESPSFESIARDESRLIEVDFADSSRLIGYLVATDDGTFGFRADGISGTLLSQSDQVVAISGSATRFAAPELPGIMGTLTTKVSKLNGCLVNNPHPSDDAVLLWQPWSSTNAAPISRDHSGSITYRHKRTYKPIANTSMTPRAPVKADNPNGLGALIGGIFGGGGQPKPVANNVAKVGPKQDAEAQLERATPKFEIVFRSGDTVDGFVESVNEKGVKFQSDETTTTFVPHEQMDSITLSRLVSKPTFDEVKLKRLMTVPRSKKDDPPTHLFMSTLGDYLRGRLVGVNADAVGVEVRLGVQEIPRAKIARVIWLHERPWLDEKKVGADEQGEVQPEPVVEANTQFLVHAVRTDKRGVTFAPTKLIDGILSGDSELLGECSVRLDAIGSLLFGRDVGEKALALRKESWKLSLAALPKAYLDSPDGEGSPSAGISSPLVGNDAPEIKLDTIDGVEFVLSENRDKVIVLDFWASWCGPCIQTMPKVEEIVEGFDPHDVELVAVNLQDSVERAKIAVKRMDLNGTVVMDVDGEAGRFYDARAIPQTVIVDRKGKISHVFVGGGSKFLDQLSAALKEVVAQ